MPRFHSAFCLLPSAILSCLLSSASAQEDPFALGVRNTPWLKPEEEQKKFKLPEGFEINLVAAEPDIQKPLNMQFDEKGRIWLTCSVEYPYAAPLDKPGRDSIRVLEDTDGDGRFEKVTVFADGLNIPMGIYPWKGGCIAYSIPNIWHFEDADGDGKSDKRTVLYGPFDHTRDTHGMCNAFRRGFDGWVYACHGFNNDSHVKGKDGHEIHMNSGNTFRFKLDGSRIEHFTHGQVNPFGMCFDELFNIFTADCHSKPIYQLLRGGYYPSFGKPDDGLGFVPPMMDHLHGSTAICGLTTYTGENFPKEYRGQFFSGNVMTSRINRNKPEYHGSTIKAIEQPDFLSTSDPWFRPVDIHIGPDGAMYILDFYNRIIGHYEVPLPHPGRDRTSGRIWRVAYRGNAEGTKPAGKPGSIDLTKMSVKELIGQLDQSNLEQRLRVLNYLVDVRSNDRSELAIEKLEIDRKAPRAAVSLIWLLARLEKEKAVEVISLSIAVTSRDVRVHATKMLSELQSEGVFEPSPEHAPVEKTDPFVIRATADAIGRHGNSKWIPVFLEELRKTPADDELLKMALRIAVRDRLAKITSMADVNKLNLGSEDKSALSDIAVAVPTSTAALMLIEQISVSDVPPAKLLSYLQHAARFAPAEGVVSLEKATRAKFASDFDLQASILQSVHSGLIQRGQQDAVVSLTPWGEELSRKLLSLDKENAIPWTNFPVEGLPASESPWVLEKRVSQDGDKESFFFGSLPKGEQKTGIYRSSSFPLPAKLSFWCAGHDTIPSMPLGKKNFIQLKDAKTGEILASSPPPRNDTAQKIQWDLSQHKDNTGYLEIVDGDTGSGYAWLAVGRFSVPGLNPSKQSQHQIAAAEIAGKLKLQSLRSDFVKILVATNTDGAARGAIGQMLLALHPDSRAAALVGVIGDPALPENLRPKLGEAIASREPKKLDEALKLAVKEVPHRLQTTMAETLAGDKDGIESLLALVNSGNLSPRLLISPNVSAKLKAGGSDGQKKQAADLTANLASVDDVLEKLIFQRRVDYAKANPTLDKGAALFTKHCEACHQIEGKGAVVGPQLDGIGLRGVERLIEDLLDPNRNVDVAFRTTTIQTDDGQVISALVRREEGALLVLVDNKGKEFSLPKASIERQQKTGLSLMPANVHEIVTSQEFYDLIGYLASKRLKRE
jgi:putative heme-binding domain-containing protein